MFNSYFEPSHQVLLISAIILLGISAFVFELSQKLKVSVFLLLSGTFLLRLFVIFVDPHINLWDEQFHALVAKNFTEDPFTPKLYPQHLLDYDFKDWAGNYIWLHKQPWFLWQMAVFIKFFGTTAFAVRLPDVFCFTFAVFCVYRIGKLMFTTRIGFIGALLFSCNYFFAEQMVSLLPTDHNDIVFISYVLASIWCLAEYLRHPKLKWLILLTLFCSFAVLTKWLTGYLVFGVWFIYLILATKSVRSQFDKWKRLILTFGASLILPMSWQFYIHNRFPEEAAYEKDYNWKHLTEVVEQHSGDNFYYIDNFSLTIAPYAAFFIIPGIFLLARYAVDRRFYYGLLAAFTVVFLFFTFAVTKMPGFTSIVYFVLYLGFGAIGEYIFQSLKTRVIINKLFLAGLVVYSAIVLFNIETFQKYHTKWKRSEFGILNFRNHNLDWLHTCERLKNKLGNEKYVVFNCDPYDVVKTMFYTDYIAYSGIPQVQQIETVRKQGFKVAVLNKFGLPDYILNDSSIYKFRLVRDEIVYCDTVEMKLSDNSYLQISPEGVYAAPDSGSKIIVTTFVNNATRLSNLDGKIASADPAINGKMQFNKDLCEVYERFKLERIGNKYCIRTDFDEDLVTLPDSKFYHSRLHVNKPFLVEFVKRN